VSGSLKAALKQIVDQLGAEFSQYIEDIKSSIDRFSAQTAREELISELALEINSRWEQRDHKPLPKRLKPLGDVLLSPGYRRWLGRSEGTIAQKIARLTESSTQDDREKNIVFTLADLKPPIGTLKRKEDAPQVHDFIEDLEYDNDTADEAIKALNLALIDAQRELTGIKGTKLNEIFTAVRRKLFEQGKQLAVFIEDVTAASGGLDLDLFQAFEPKEGKDLSRMIALLGMTNTSWNPLTDNQKDRVNPEYDIGENATQWAADPEDISRFAARYLNAIRYNDQEIDYLAKNRFFSDVPRSRCDGCPHKEPCHKTFGYAQLGDNVRIGLFPFSETAPEKLLKSLNEERHRTSPRGLLDYVLNFALIKSYDQFPQKAFPDARNFGVNRESLTYWTEVENKYLGGNAWSTGSHRSRARFLAEFWFDANSPDKAAGLLEPYRIPLSLPEFSEQLVQPKIPTDEPPVPPVKPFTPTEDKELKDLLTRLEEWRRGEKLTEDSKFRIFLSRMIEKVIRWQDHRGVPIKFASDTTRGTKPIRIERQTSKVMGQYYFLDFPHDDETSQLLEALVRYEREGKRSWNFESGELHKRRVFRWLRKNQPRIIKSLEPIPPTLTKDAVKAASQLLALTAVLRTRAPLLKKEPQERLKELFAVIWEEMAKPQTVAANLLGRIINDIEIRSINAKELIISELGVGQGDAPPKDFIDPLPIFEALEEFEAVPVVKPMPKAINENFWQTRFEVVAKLSAYADLRKALDEENKAIANHLATLKEFLLGCGFNGKDMKKELRACVDKIIEVIEIQKKNMPYPNDEFDNLWELRRLQGNRDAWGMSVDQAAKIIANPTDMDILCFDPTSFKQARSDLIIVTKKHLAVVEKELSEQENPSGPKQSGSKEDLLNELKQISKILDKD
jgi:hypothetical protein